MKDLWSVLAPVGHHMSLKHLSGQTLAVDLSIWVCETQGVKKMQGVVTKPHLRYMKGPIIQVYASFFLPHYFDQCMHVFILCDAFTKYDLFSGGYLCQNIKHVQLY